MNSNQQNTNTGQIPNVASVIKASVDNIKASNDALKIIVNSLSATINNLPDDISKHKKTFETLIPMINSYMESVVNVINVLSKDFNGKDFNSLLGIIKERDEDTKKIKTTYTNLDAILKIGEVIDEIVGTVEKVSKNEIKFNSFIKLKLNLILLKHSLNTIIDDVLNSITADEDMSKKITYLIGSGDKQITQMDKTYNEKGEILSDKSKIEDIKSPGGLLTALSLSLDIVNSFNSISFPNFITFWIRMKIFKNRLKKITKGIFNLFDQLVGEKSETIKSNLESFKTTISLINDNLDSINDVLDSIANFNKIHMLSKGATSVFGKYDDNGKRVKDGDLIKIFKGILYFVESREVMAMANKSRFSQMEQIADNISSIMVIIDAVKKIMSSVIIVALLTVPFILACPVILASVWILAGLMYVIHGALVVIGNKANTKIVEFSVKNIIQQLMWIAGLMILSVGTLAIIALLSPFIIKSAKDTILTIGMIVLVILAMVAIGALISLISPLIAATTTIMIGIGIIIGCIALIAISLTLLTKLKIDENKRKEIKDSVNSIVGTAKDVMNIIFGEFDDRMGSNGTKNGDDGLILTLLKWVGGDMFVNVIKIIMASAILLFAIISVGAVWVLGHVLSLLKTSPLSKADLGENGTIHKSVSDIMNTAKLVINTIFGALDDRMGSNGTKNGDDGLILTLLKWVAGDMFVNVIKIIMANMLLLSTVMAVGMVWILGHTLSLLKNIPLTDNDVKTDGTIHKNVTNIMSAAKGVIAAVNAPTDSVKKGDNSIGRNILEALLPSGLVNMIDAIMAIGTLGPMVLAVGAVGFMAKQLNSIQELELKDDIQTRAQAIITSGKDIVKLINDESFKGIDVDDVIERASAMKLVTESINELGKDVNIENHTKLTENTIKLIDKIDKSKLENLQTAHNMFKEMKEFSESISGNFDGLAEALNEKIAPLLEELKELIGKIPESVDKSASTISTSMYNTTSIASGTATTSTMRAQVQSENPTMSKEDIGKVVDQRMAQQAQSVNKGIEMRLEELLDVLQNYSNPIPVRMS